MAVGKERVKMEEYGVCSIYLNVGQMLSKIYIEGVCFFSFSRQLKDYSITSGNEILEGCIFWTHMLIHNAGV